MLTFITLGLCSAMFRLPVSKQNVVNDLLPEFHVLGNVPNTDIGLASKVLAEKISNAPSVLIDLEDSIQPKLFKQKLLANDLDLHLLSNDHRFNNLVKSKEMKSFFDSDEFAQYLKLKKLLDSPFDQGNAKILGKVVGYRTLLDANSDYLILLQNDKGFIEYAETKGYKWFKNYIAENFQRLMIHGQVPYDKLIELASLKPKTSWYRP